MTGSFEGITDCSEEFKKIEKTTRYREIKRALLKQLENNTVAKEVFEDLVSDYMKMYVIKELLINDIKKIGATVSYRASNGYTTLKTNSGITDFNKINLQMTKLLDKLKLDPIIEEDDEDEL